MRALRLQIGDIHSYNNGWIYFNDFPLPWNDYKSAARFIDTRNDGFIRHMGYESRQ